MINKIEKPDLVVNRVLAQGLNLFIYNKMEDLGLKRVPTHPNNEDLYGHVCTAQTYFMDKLQAAVMLLDKHEVFIDAGSGVGITLLLASHWFNDVRGIEIYEPYVDFFNEHISPLLGDTRHEVILDDITAYDYSVTDLVFFYRPFKNTELGIAFEQKLIKELPIGGVIISNMGYGELCKSNKFVCPYPDVYLKIND